MSEEQARNGRGLLAATKRALADSGQADHPDGFAALILAERIVTYPVDGKATDLVAMIKEQRIALTAALASAPPAPAAEQQEETPSDNLLGGGAGGWTPRLVDNRGA